MKRIWAEMGDAERARRKTAMSRGVRKALKDPTVRAKHKAAVQRGGVTRTTPIEERFWASVDKNGPKQPHMKTRCWVWVGSKQTLKQRGSEDRIYGLITKGGKYGGSMLAHRFSYELHKGKDRLRKKRQVQHRCDVPLCVRPTHLKRGKPQDNSNDMKKRNRPRGGQTHKKFKAKP